MNKVLVRRYMLSNLQDHIDPRTGEVNSTSLAEDACEHFKGYDKDDETIPEEYFELAAEVGINHERKTGVGK